MKKVKGFSGILLALCLVLSLLPGAAMAAAHPFTDVPDGIWYSGAVQYVYENGMMNGTDTDRFSPGDPTSRGMIVTILHRMEGLPAAEGKTFQDVAAGLWYSDAVAWASANGIVNGYDADSFGPNDPITREQMAAILYRYAGEYKGYTVESTGDVSSFVDGGTVSSYALDAMRWAVGVGLIQGMDGNMLSPAGGAIRAQAATILMRFCEEVAPSYAVSSLAGLDVTCRPSGILILDDGSALVTDTYHKVIWRVANGASTVYAGGDGTTFEYPWAIAPFQDGYAVSDADAGVVRLVQSGGSVTSLSGAFQCPTGLACDEDGNLYVSDTHAGTVYKITSGGDAAAFASGLNDPMGLCWKDGTLYVAETGANQIVKITDGQRTVVAGNGEDDLVNGPAAQAAFAAPQGVAVGDDGTIYVSDTVNGAVRMIQNGMVTTMIQQNASDLTSFSPTSPMGMMLYGTQLYVCDNFARTVLVLSLA